MECRLTSVWKKGWSCIIMDCCCGLDLDIPKMVSFNTFFWFSCLVPLPILRINFTSSFSISFALSTFFWRKKKSVHLSVDHGIITSIKLFLLFLCEFYKLDLGCEINRYLKMWYYLICFNLHLLRAQLSQPSVSRHAHYFNEQPNED